MSAQRKIARNVIWSWSGTLTDMIVGFVLARYLYLQLGETRYGWWLIIASLTSYFSFFDLGVRASVGRNIAFHRARGDGRQVKAIFSTAFLFLTGVAALIFLGTMALPQLFFHWYSVSAEEQASVQLALLLVGANLALTFPLSVFDGVLWAYQRFDIHNAIDIPISLLRGGVALALVASGGGLVALACVIVSATLLTAVLKAALSFRMDRELRIGIGHMTREAARDLFGFGIWQFLLSIGRRIPAQLAAPVIGARLGPAFVPPQSVAARLPSYAESFVFAASGVLTPVATGLHATENHDEHRTLFLEGGKYCAALALFFVVPLLCIGEAFITLWIGAELASVGVLLAILAVGELLPLSQWISFSVVLGMGRHRELALFSILENVLVVGLLLALVGPLGVPGVCLAVAVPGTLCRGVLQLVYTCRLMGVSLWNYVGHVFVPAGLTAAAPTALLTTLRVWREPATWLELVAFAALFGVTYVAMGSLVLLGWERTRALVGQLSQGILQVRYGTSSTN